MRPKHLDNQISQDLNINIKDEDPHPNRAKEPIQGSNEATPASGKRGIGVLNLTVVDLTSGLVLSSCLGDPPQAICLPISHRYLIRGGMTVAFLDTSQAD